MAAVRGKASGSLTSATDATDDYLIVNNETFDFSLVGSTWTGTVQLQRRRPGDSTWRVWKSFTDDVEDWEYCAGQWEVQFYCSAWTAGSMQAELYNH